MTQAVQRVVIVGGGTAGWLTAGIIAARHQGRMKAGFSVTLVESPNIPIIGVGEGTWPTLRATLEKMGVSETDLFRHSDAAFKQGAKFARWTTGADDDRYYHPLMLPQGFTQLNLAPALAERYAGQELQRIGLSAGAALRGRTGAQDDHHARIQGRRQLRLPSGCRQVRTLPAEALHREARRAPCAGGRGERESERVGRHRERDDEASGGDRRRPVRRLQRILVAAARQDLGRRFKDCSDVLFCDTALALQIPYDTPDAPMASHTISTAQAAGWIWDIGLPTRRGIGYVYSSRHTSEEEARETLLRYVGPEHKDKVARKIPIRAGHRETFWKNNCVAVGLAAGFLEPLESSAIVLVELSAKLIAEQMPAYREVMDIVAARFNDVNHYRWGRIIDFLKLHYVLTQRKEPFWRDNLDPQSIPDRLKNLLHLWKYQSPWFFDEFDRLEEVFPAASYQYVLYGMGFRTEVGPMDNADTESTATRLLRENAAMTKKLRSQLPKNRDLLRKIQEHGMQRI